MNNGVHGYPDGSRYEGQWLNSRRHGHGMWTKPDGTMYVGEWVNDKPNGHGTFTLPNGRKYIGEWKDGRRHGQGVEIQPDGTKFFGEWKEGKLIDKRLISPENIRSYQENGNIKGDIKDKPEEQTVILTEAIIDHKKTNQKKRIIWSILLSFVLIGAVFTYTLADKSEETKRPDMIILKNQEQEQEMRILPDSPHPWPMPNYNTQRTGRTPFKGPSELPVLKWFFEAATPPFGSDDNLAVASDNTVYLNGRDHLYAINQDGSVRWAYKFPEKETISQYANSPLISTTGIIYIASSTANVYALNPDGTVRWKCATGKDHIYDIILGFNDTVHIIAHQYPSSPSDRPRELITINADGVVDNSIISPREDILKSRISIGADGTLYGGYERLYSWNLDGSINWMYDTGMDIRYVPPIVGGDGTVYVVFNESEIHAVNLDGTLKWKSEHFNIGRELPVIGPDGTIYFFSMGTGLVALDSQNGTIKWTYKITDAISRSLIIDGTKNIYVQGWRIYVINTEGKLKWSYNWGLATNRHTSVALGNNNIIYYLIENKLHAIGP